MCNTFTGPPGFENVRLLLNQMFCFTVPGLYYLLVVYSLYRELKNPTPGCISPLPITINNNNTNI